jgi:hemin uptake protein HemP
MSNFHLTPSNTLPPPHTSRDYERTMRATLSLAAGRSAGEVHTPVARPAAHALRAPLSAITAAANVIDTVPLKRLTAGRKALKIAHAGETYLLRITKANKLILTKPAVEEKTPLYAKA